MRKYSRLALRILVPAVSLVAIVLLVVAPAHSGGIYHGDATASAFGGFYAGTCSIVNSNMHCTLQLVSGTPVPKNTKAILTIYNTAGTFEGCTASISASGKMTASLSW